MKRTMKSQTYYLMTIGVILVSLVSCKPEIETKLVPVLSTETISSITQNTAVCGGNITSDNGLEVTARGVCWNLKPNPTINDSLTKNSAGTGKFICNLNNLLPDTTYYVRAYATNSVGTAYGLQVTFKTLKATLPTITTTKATNLTDISATSGGNITFNGGTEIIERGVCWSINSFPTVLDNKTTDGAGNGNFTSSISGLTSGTTYYIRSYAVNKTGTGYGNQDTIKTLTLPTIQTNSVTDITKSTANSSGNVISDGGSPVTARGVVWSTSENPTTSLITKTTNGFGLGYFNSSLVDLKENTTYFLRAYATNSIGTSYGQQVSFDTYLSGTFTDTRDGNAYKWVKIGNQIWMAENLRYLPSVVGPKTSSDANPLYYVYGYDGNLVDAAKLNSNYNIYGVLYNYQAAITSAPTGWRLPTINDWTQLSDYLGGTSIAGGKLKETGTNHWLSPNNATNEYNFTALPGGCRSNSGGEFNNIKQTGYWWSKSATGASYYVHWEIYPGSTLLNKISESFDASPLVGFSVRCIKN